MGQGVLGRAQVVGNQSLGEALGDQIGHGLTEQLIAAIAELLLGLDVEQDDDAILVDDDHRVGRGLEEPPVAGF